MFPSLFPSVFLCSTPAYDYAPNPDKQWILQVTDRMEPIHRKFTDILMTKRLQTLQSIDEAIERVRNKFDHVTRLQSFPYIKLSDI